MSFDFSSRAHTTQNLKRVLANSPRWADLQDDQKEALEVVVREIGLILHSDPNHTEPWHVIAAHARLVGQRLAHEQHPSAEEQMKPDVNQAPEPAPAPEGAHPTCLVCGKAHPNAVTSFFVELDADDIDKLEAEAKAKQRRADQMHVGESPAAAHFRRVIESQILAEVFRGARAQPKRAAGL